MGGDAGEEGLELAGPLVESRERAAMSIGGSEDFISVSAGNGRTPAKRTGGQLNRVGGGTRDQTAPLRERPNLRLRDGAAGDVQEYEEPAIGCPAAATLTRGRVPAWNYLVKIGAA